MEKSYWGDQGTKQLFDLLTKLEDWWCAMGVQLPGSRGKSVHLLERYRKSRSETVRTVVLQKLRSRIRAFQVCKECKKSLKRTTVIHWYGIRVKLRLGLQDCICASRLFPQVQVRQTLIPKGDSKRNVTTTLHCSFEIYVVHWSDVPYMETNLEPGYVLSKWVGPSITISNTFGVITWVLPSQCSQCRLKVWSRARFIFKWWSNTTKPSTHSRLFGIVLQRLFEDRLSFLRLYAAYSLPHHLTNKPHELSWLPLLSLLGQIWMGVNQSLGHGHVFFVRDRS